MEHVLSSFSQVEYLTIFATFVYGYVAAQFFYGWGSMISHRKQIVYSKEHLAWTIVTFILFLDVWWGSWLKGLFISRHRLFFYLSLLSPLIFYILSIIQFPPLDDAKNQNLKSYFNNFRRYNYIAFIVLGLSFYLNDVFLQNAPITDHLANTGAIMLAIIGFVSKRKWVHLLIISIGGVLLVYHMSTLKSFKDAQFAIENFTVTEYLTIFTAFIYGGVATRFFSGWGNLVYNAEKVKISKTYLAWTIFMFALLMDLWWSQWSREPFIAQNIGYFIISLSTPIVCYFVSVLMFPVVSKEDGVDLRTFFTENKKTIYFLLGLILATNFVVANLMEAESIFNVTNILRLMAIAMAIVGISINRIAIDRTLLIMAYGMIAFHAVFAEM
jgi:hypothetical protein